MIHPWPPHSLLIEAFDASVRIGETTLINNISISLKRGEIVSLIGPNGAGKTTLVKMLLGIIAPSTGRIKRAAALRIGYVPQNLKFEPTLPLSVGGFLKLGTGATPSALNEALESVGVPHLAHAMMAQLSGGETQRVLLARALIRQPDLLVLDEPAQGLDVSGEADLFRLVQDIRDERQCGVLIVSHDLHMVMAATDKVLCINKHICCSGKPDSVAQDPAFLSLFGPQAAQVLAPYAHVHDHHHNVSGELADTQTKDAP